MSVLLLGNLADKGKALGAGSSLRAWCVCSWCSCGDGGCLGLYVCCVQVRAATRLDADGCSLRGRGRLLVAVRLGFLLWHGMAEVQAATMQAFHCQDQPDMLVKQCAPLGGQRHACNLNSYGESQEEFLQQQASIKV